MNLAFRRKEMAKRKKRRTVFQEILIILTVVFAFMTSACVNKREMVSEHLVAFVVTAVADAFILASWLLTAGRAFMRKKKRKETFQKWFCKNKGILSVLLYCFFTRIIQFQDTPRWDGLIYYRNLMAGCQNFDFSIFSFLSCFSLANHPTQGFAGIVAIGEFLNPGGYVGMLSIQLLMDLLMAFCLYRILEYMLPKCTWIYHTIGSCIVLSSPLALGTFSYFQPDAGTVYFFIFVLYCYIFKRNLLMFFSMVLLILSKEIGIVALGGFGMGAFLGYMFLEGKENGFWKKLFSFFRKPLGIAGILAGIMLLIYFVFFMKSGGNVWSISNENIAGFSTFSFQPRFIVYKWKQFFVLNFNWLLWGGIVAMILFLTVRSWNGHGFSKWLRRKDIAIAVFLTVAAEIIFYCFYVTYALPRYHVLVDFGAAFLFVILLGICVSEGERKYFAAMLLNILFLVEAYVTIDPVTLFAFENADTGNSRILTDRLDVSAQSDFCVYNHQFNYLNKAYDNVLKDVGYYEGMNLIIWDREWDYSIWANDVLWDSGSEKRVLLPGDDTFSITGCTREAIENGEVDIEKETIFIMTPQFGIEEDVTEEYLKKYFEIRYKGTVEIPLGGVVTFYVCDELEQGEMQE